MYELIITAVLWICALVGKWIVYRLSPEEECFQIYAIAMPLVSNGQTYLLREVKNHDRMAVFETDPHERTDAGSEIC